MAETGLDAVAEEIVDEVEYVMDSLLDAFNPFKNKLNWLLIALPLAVYFNYDHNLTMAFLFSMISIMPLAFLMGKGTEEIACSRIGISLGRIKA